MHKIRGNWSLLTADEPAIFPFLFCAHGYVRQRSNLNVHLVKSITLKSGSKGVSNPLELSPTTVNLFLGPNNSGKSLFLREIQQFFTHGVPNQMSRVLKDCKFHSLDKSAKTAIAAQLIQEPPENVFVPENHIFVGIRANRTQMSRDFFLPLLDNLNQQAACLNAVRFLVLLLDGASRLGILNDSPRGDLLQPPQNLLTSLFVDDLKRKEVRRIIYSAFGRYFVIDPTSTTNLRVRFSSAEPDARVERSFDQESVSFHSQAELIQNTSDGIRAFCGMVAAVIEGNPKIILLDEPEAFLHPALSNKLAKALCEEARKNQQQLFVASHSASFLMGCIQAGIGLNIIRLTYRDGIATSRLLQSDKIIPLMRNPLLRSTGVLEGLFYESVIVTESDTDRSFYDEINHRLLRSNSNGIPNCLFLNAQNWQTTGRIIQPLRDLGVAAAAVVDIDVVTTPDNAGFQSLMDSAGVPEGTRKALGQLRGTLKSHIEASGIKIKKQGISGLSGDDQADLRNLITQLATYGIFLVPVGELEQWLPELRRSGNGESWLMRTFEAMGENPDDPNYLRPGTDDVWRFIEEIRLWLHNPNRLGIPQ